MRDLTLIEDLVNTRFVDAGTDDLGSAADLAAWLQERDELAPGATVTAADLERALVVREGLRAVIARNNAGDHAGVDAVADAVDPEALARLADIAPDLALVLDVATDPPVLRPIGTGAVDALLARLLGAVAVAVADGRWKRMKACGQPGCRWAYYDSSRNTSRAWCDMTTCGNRAKARAFRERQR